MSEDYNAGVDAEAAAQPENVSMEHGEESKTVPLEALQSIRDELKDLKSENRSLRDNLRTYSDHFEMMTAQQKQSQQSQQQDIFEGSSEDDFLTVGQAKHYWNQMQQYQNQLSQQTQQSTAELQVMAQNPDYKEVIETYLPLAMEEDPELKKDIQSASNPYKYAYKMAKRSTAYMKDNAKKGMSRESQKVMDNFSQPRSLSATGTPAPVSAEGKFKQMSDSDFRKLIAKNAGLT